MPCEVLTGVVECVNPVKVRIGEILLEGEVLRVCEHLFYKEYTIPFAGYDKTVVINEGIKEGDIAVLLRQSGGEAYVMVGVTDRR